MNMNICRQNTWKEYIAEGGQGSGLSIKNFEVFRSSFNSNSATALWPWEEYSISLFPF